MAATAKQLYVGTPGTSEATCYTVPANTTTIVKNIVLTNTTGSSANVSISVAGKNLVNAYSINANDTITIDLSLVMKAGQTISVWQGTSNAINVFISGVEVS